MNSEYISNCDDCIHPYGCSKCMNCLYYCIGNKKKNNFFKKMPKLKSEILDIKPNTIEITIPEGVESIVINFKKK